MSANTCSTWQHGLGLAAFTEQLLSLPCTGVFQTCKHHWEAEEARQPAGTAQGVRHLPMAQQSAGAATEAWAEGTDTRCCCHCAGTGLPGDLDTAVLPAPAPQLGVQGCPQHCHSCTRCGHSAALGHGLCAQHPAPSRQRPAQEEGSGHNSGRARARAVPAAGSARCPSQHLQLLQERVSAQAPGG